MYSGLEYPGRRVMGRSHIHVRCAARCCAALVKRFLCFTSAAQQRVAHVDDMDRKFLRCCFPPVHYLHLCSLKSKAIRMGSDLETTTFSSQSATILAASLLLQAYVVFFDLNRFLLYLYVFLIASFLFFMHVLEFFTVSTRLYRCHCF